MTGVSLLSPYRIPQHGGVFCIKSEQRRKRNTSQPLPLCSGKEYRGSARRARGLKFKQEHKPRFRLYRAAKTQGRRKKKGKDCPSEASSADPGGDRNDGPKSPITAAALLGSFFSLLRRMNKDKRFFTPSHSLTFKSIPMNFLLNHNTNKNTILSPSHRTPITIIPRYDQRLPLKKNNLQTTLFHYIFVLYINSLKFFDNTSAFKTKTSIMKKITLLLTFFICLNISLNAQTYPKKENVIRLLTYNTHYCKGGSDPGSIDDYNTRRLASVIEALDPDVVALQELDSAMSDRRRRDLLKQISEFTGLDYQHIFGGLAPINGGKVGPGLLFKKDLEVVKKKIIPLAGDEARSAVRVDFEKFTFMGTHLDLNDAKRTQSASTLVNETDFIRKPCFLAGDLNDSHRWSNGGIAFPVLADKFSIVSDTEGNTIPGRTDNGALIDYILFKDYKDSGIKIVETHIVRTLKVNGSVIDLGSISDHYPVYVDIEIPGLSGIENATRSNSIRIYPTQVQNTLNIQSESPVRKINIYSMTGQKQLEANNPGTASVDISSLSNGIYIVEIFADNGTTFKGKIIKR